MKKALILAGVLAFTSCKSTEKCDAYSMVVHETIVFPADHFHTQDEACAWHCYEFPVDSIEIHDTLVIYLPKHR